MKILIITDAWLPQLNGVVRTYENLGAAMRRRGHEVKVIGPADFPFKFPLPTYPEIKVTLFPYRRLSKMIEEYQPDKIHLSVEGSLGQAGRKYCLKHGRGFSTSYHTQFPDYVAKRFAKFMPPLYGFFHELGKRYVRKFHSRASITMVATPSLRRTLQSWGFKNPMHHLTRGVDLDLFNPGEKTLFKDLKRPIALYVGRVAIEKNIEKFLEMDWAGSKVIVGTGPSMDELQSKFPDAHFVGIKVGEDLAAHYRSADLFVFPSRTDTFGMVIPEALACGLPVAAYNVTGPMDIITEDFLGALDDDNLGAAAKKALNAPGTAQERFDHVVKYYTWDVTAEQYEDALMNKVP